MSLCDAIVQADVVYLLSDAGVWHWDGRLAEVRSKMRIFPEMQLAITFRGTTGIPPSWEGWNDYKSQGDLFAALPDLVRQVTGLNALFHFGKPSRHNVETTVAFWDHGEGRPRAVQMDTATPGLRDLNGGGYAVRNATYRPYAWFNLPALAIAPGMDWDEALPDVPMDNLDDVHRLDVASAAPRIVEAQRAVIHEVEDRRMRLVAGFVEMAKVTRDTVTVEKIVTWREDRPSP